MVHSTPGAWVEFTKSSNIRMVRERKLQTILPLDIVLENVSGNWQRALTKEQLSELGPTFFCHTILLLDGRKVFSIGEALPKRLS